MVGTYELLLPSHRGRYDIDGSTSSALRTMSKPERLQTAGRRFSPSPTDDDFARALQLGFAVVVPPAVEVQ
jgi:hypothetical protein